MPKGNNKAVGQPQASLHPARDRCDAFGLEAMCEHIANTVGMKDLAKKIGVDLGSLLTWFEADPPRIARVNETRRMAARMWDEKAEEVIAKAKTPFAFQKARELAHHYRWRAAKIAPKEYGDKMALTDGEGKPLQGAAPPVFNVTVKGK